MLLTGFLVYKKKEIKFRKKVKSKPRTQNHGGAKREEDKFFVMDQIIVNQFWSADREREGCS